MDLKEFDDELFEDLDIYTFNELKNSTYESIYNSKDFIKRLKSYDYFDVKIPNHVYLYFFDNFGKCFKYVHENSEIYYLMEFIENSMKIDDYSETILIGKLIIKLLYDFKFDKKIFKYVMENKTTIIEYLVNFKLKYEDYLIEIDVYDKLDENEIELTEHVKETITVNYEFGYQDKDFFTEPDSVDFTIDENEFYCGYVETHTNPKNLFRKYYKYLKGLYYYGLTDYENFFSNLNLKSCHLNTVKSFVTIFNFDILVDVLLRKLMEAIRNQ